MSTTPYPYQVEGVRLIHEKFNGRAFLCDSMGLGKTPQALWYARDHLPPNEKVVIVCPASIKWNWEAEIRKHLRASAEVLEGRTPGKAGRVRRGARFYVLNYDILGPGSGPDKTWCKFLRALRPGLVICDEFHYAKEPSAKRTRWVYDLCEGVEKVLLLTGTPMTNKPKELFTGLRLLRPDVFPNFRGFARRYCDPRLKPWGMTYDGATNTEELHQLLKSSCMIRRLKSEVMKDLPPLTETIVPLELTAAARKEYGKAEADFIAWLKETHPQRASSARKAERLVRAGYLKRLSGKLKLPAVKAWIDDFTAGTDEKLLTFGVQRDSVVLALADHYGRAATAVTGKVTGRDRQRCFDRFNTDRGCRLFFGNVVAAGVGWSCTSASTVCFAELDWVPANHSQAANRIHGQNRGVAGKASACYWLVGRGTMDEHLVKIIRDKQAVSDEVLDGVPRDAAANRVLDELEKVMLLSSKKKGVFK